jgi:small subunit ribosomal protein S20
MANIKSSKKDLKRTARNRARNQTTKSALKTYVKRVRQSLSGEPAAIEQSVTTAVKQLDKAAQRGIIHKNQAARRKSRIAKAANVALAAKS